MPMGGMRLEANTRWNTKSPFRDRDHEPEEFDTGELWKIKNEKLYITKDWTQERMRELFEDKSHSVGNT